jgi:hypothetical protein
MLTYWWDARNKSAQFRKLFAQTTRLALLHLALRMAGTPDVQQALTEVRSVLFSTVRPDGMWGDYTLPGVAEDPSPRLLPTAIAVLSFVLFKNPEEQIPEVLYRATGRLEERLLGSRDLPLLHVAAASAAIIGVNGAKASKQIRRQITRIAYKTLPALPELGVYFYDVGYNKDNGEIEFTRDYFIVPTEVLLGIAGYQDGAPTYLRLRAESSLRLLSRNLRGYDGYYRPDNEQRVSSMNQLWVAMYLGMATRESPGVPTRRITFELMKQRADAFWIDMLLLGGCLIGVLLGSLVSFPALTVTSLFVKALVAILAFVAGRLYAPAALRKIFPGRE